MKDKKPWIVLAVCCGLAASSIGISINSSGVFYTPVSESLGIMRGTFSMHMTIFSFVTALTALFVPKLMKKFSYKLILIVSVVVAVISTGAMAYAKDVTMFYLLGAIRGLSTGMFSIVPLTMIVNEWFHKNHGFATSIVFGFSGLAGSICSPILTQCIENFGWQMGYIVKAIIILVLCLPAMIYPFALNPQDEGLLPYGYEEQIENRESSSYRSFHFITLGFICFFIFGLIVSAVTGITQHLPGFSQTVGYSATLGAMLLSSAMVGNIVSKLIIGVISDKFGPVKATLLMIMANVAGVILLILAPSELIVLVGAFLFGSVYSVGAVGVPLLTKYFFGKENYAQVFPSISFASNLGAAFALSIVGYIYDFTGSYLPAFMMCLMINGVCILLIMMILKTTKEKNNG